MIDARHLSAGLAAGLLLAAPATAATFQIELAGQATTFDAPLSGGPITGLSVTIAGIAFDTPQAGPGAPVYDPVDNDINSDGGLFGYFVNSVDYAECMAGDCLLEFEDAEADTPPKLWAAFSLPGGIFGEFFGSGEYTITPPDGGPDGVVPLPAAGWLLAGALGALAVRRRARKG